MNRMFVGTWNVGGKSPHQELDLGDWLNSTAPADIYVLGKRPYLSDRVLSIFALFDVLEFLFKRDLVLSSL
ncbi:hypothetical protein P3S68_011325 [Capsicum galapagoense]